MMVSRENFSHNLTIWLNNHFINKEKTYYIESEVSVWLFYDFCDFWVSVGDSGRVIWGLFEVVVRRSGKSVLGNRKTLHSPTNHLVWLIRVQITAFFVF